MLTKQLSGGAIRFRSFRDRRGYLLSDSHPVSAVAERFIAAGRNTAEEAGGKEALFRAAEQHRLSGPYIVPRSFELEHRSNEQFDVALGEAKIFADLLTAGDTDKGVLDFCHKWGTFHGTPLAKSEFRDFRKEILAFYRKKSSVEDVAKWYSRVQKSDADPVSLPVGSFELVFTKASRASKPEMTWYARSIRGFIVLEVLADLGGISEVSLCSTCGLYFKRNGRTGPFPEHCSNACRQRAYRRRQALAAE